VCEKSEKYLTVSFVGLVGVNPEESDSTYADGGIVGSVCTFVGPFLFYPIYLCSLHTNKVNRAAKQTYGSAQPTFEQITTPKWRDSVEQELKEEGLTTHYPDPHPRSHKAH
jgi:hypothetical protein